MAMCLLTTSGIAVVSMIFALRDGVNAPLGRGRDPRPARGRLILTLTLYPGWLSMVDTPPRVRALYVSTLAPAGPGGGPRARYLHSIVLRIFASDINQHLFTYAAEGIKGSNGACKAGSGEQQDGQPGKAHIQYGPGHTEWPSSAPPSRAAAAVVAIAVTICKGSSRLLIAEVTAREGLALRRSGQNCVGGLPATTGNWPRRRRRYLDYHPRKARQKKKKQHRQDVCLGAAQAYFVTGHRYRRSHAASRRNQSTRIQHSMHSAAGPSGSASSRINARRRPAGSQRPTE